MTAPFTPGSADFVRASNIEALGRMGMVPIPLATVQPRVPPSKSGSSK